MYLLDWNKSDYFKDIGQALEPVISYIVSRGHDPFDGNFYWSPLPGYESRVIIPFRWQGRIVGNTARKITVGKPKYLSDHHSHFVFNFDQQSEDQRYTFVCEGPFDALSISGVALLTNDIAEQQARIITSLGNEVIVIPDQDRAGLALFDRASELNWAVAMPTWDSDVKDVAEAVQRYGKLFVVVDAIKTAQRGTIKINMAKKQQEQKIERAEYEKNN
jgi:DNA primase